MDTNGRASTISGPKDILVGRVRDTGGSWDNTTGKRGAGVSMTG